MLEYLLIAFIVAVALVPLSHFRPSRRQRAVSQMREAAAIDGLFVEFRQLPGPEGRVSAPEGELIYYGLRLPAATTSGLSPGYWLRERDGWRAGQRPEITPGPPQELPEAVLAASVDGGSCGIYWVESAHQDDVACIGRALRQWCQQLAAQPTR